MPTRAVLGEGGKQARFVRTLVRALGTLLGAVVACRGAIAAEIILEQTAVQKLVVQALFRSEGRFVLQGGVCGAYLENPTVSMRSGRIVIRTHFSGRFGTNVSGRCVGVGLASWTTVSGQPTASDALVRLDDIRIDDVEDSNTRALLQLGLLPALPGAVELDVKKAVQTMLQGAAGQQIRGEVEALTIESVRAADNRLAVKFDFTLLGR